MPKTIDAAAIVAYLTETKAADWEPGNGVSEGLGDESWFDEIGDFGPDARHVGNMVKQGYVEGVGWKITTEVDLQENDEAARLIGKDIAEGFTEGYHPRWEVNIESREPRRAYVNVDEDDVRIEVVAGEQTPEHAISKTIQEIEADPDLAAFVVEKSTKSHP